MVEKNLLTGADVPGKQNINSTSFLKFKMYMIISSNFSNILTQFCSRDAFFPAIFLATFGHVPCHLLVKRESLSITCILIMTLAFSQVQPLVPTNLKVRTEPTNAPTINPLMDHLPATVT